jgi:integrase/recombinase XerD
VTMHTLRHAFATHLHERGAGVGELRRLLGHSSVVTTMHYLGLRDGRRAELTRIGDLLAALPAVDHGQQRIAFG